MSTSDSKQPSPNVSDALRATYVGPFVSKADEALTEKPSAGRTRNAAELVKFSFDRSTSVGHADEIMDVGVGKDGVLSRFEATNVENRIMSQMRSADGRSLYDTRDGVLKQSFLIALRVYLAMHSSENADDGRGALEDGVMLTFGASSIDGAIVKAAAQMGSFHRYLRARADEVRDSIKFILARANQPDAAQLYPLACETARNIRVNAANRFMPDYPQYAFVGADYCSTVTPRVREVIAASKSALLAAQRSPESRPAHKFRDNSKTETGFPDF